MPDDHDAAAPERIDMGALLGAVHMSLQHPDGPDATFDRSDARFAQNLIADLHNHLGRVRLSSGLAFLGQLSAELWKANKGLSYFGGQAVTEWQLCFLAQELLRVASDDGGLEIYEPAVFVEAARLVNGLFDDFQLNDLGSARERYERRLSFVIRLANEQFGLQTRLGDYIPRYLSLFQALPAVRRADEPDLLAEFESAYGLGLSDFTWIGFFIFAYVVGGEAPRSVFDPHQFPDTEAASPAPAPAAEPAWF